MITLLVTVKTKSKREELFVDRKDRLVFKTNKTPKGGEINKHLQKIISKTFNISITLIRLEPKTFAWSKKKYYLDIDSKDCQNLNNKLTSLKKMDSLF